jgi:uncharacterized protein
MMRDDRLMARLSWVAFLLAAVLAVLNLAAPAFADPTYPKLTGRVTDAAGVLPAETVISLEARLKALETTTGQQLVVATVPDLGGYEIEDYGVGLGRAWGIGQKDKNSGAILLVAPNQRKVRIEVGYGLEGVLTDAMTSQIIRRNIIPSFKAGDMPGGVVAGTDALIGLLQLPADQQAQAAMQASADAGAGEDGPGFGAIVWLIIIVLWVIFSARPGARGRRRGSAIIWGPGIGGGWSGGGGGGGWSGGGGFSGGGGSFGGGGSSGSW